MTWPCARRPQAIRSYNKVDLVRCGRTFRSRAVRGAPAAKDVLLPGGVDAKLLELAVEVLDLDLELLLRLSRGHCERRFATGL